MSKKLKKTDFAKWTSVIAKLDVELGKKKHSKATETKEKK